MAYFLATHTWKRKDTEAFLREITKFIEDLARSQYKSRKKSPEILWTISAYETKPIAWTLLKAENEREAKGFYAKIKFMRTQIIEVVPFEYFERGTD